MSEKEQQTEKRVQETEKAYVTDMWEEIFQEMDQEADYQKEKEKKALSEKEEAYRKRLQKLISSIRCVLDEGITHNTNKKLKMILPQIKVNHAEDKKDIEEYLFYQTVSRDDHFLEEMKNCFDDYEIDEKSWKVIHSFHLYYMPGLKEQSEHDKIVQQYLLAEKAYTINTPLRPFHPVIFLLVLAAIFGFFSFYGGELYYLILPVACIGIHWLLYRYLYQDHRHGISHLIPGIPGVILLFCYGEWLAKAHPDSFPGTMVLFCCYFIWVFINLFLALCSTAIMEKKSKKAAKKPLMDIIKRSRIWHFCFYLSVILYLPLELYCITNDHVLVLSLYTFLFFFLLVIFLSNLTLSRSLRWLRKNGLNVEELVKDIDLSKPLYGMQHFGGRMGALIYAGEKVLYITKCNIILPWEAIREIKHTPSTKAGANVSYFTLILTDGSRRKCIGADEEDMIKLIKSHLMVINPDIIKS